MRQVFPVPMVVIVNERHRVEQDETVFVNQKSEPFGEKLLEQEIGHFGILENIDYDKIVRFFGFEDECEGVVDYNLAVRDFVERKVLVSDADDVGVDLNACDFPFAADFFRQRLDDASAGDAQNQDFLHGGYLFETDVLQAEPQNPLQAAIGIIRVPGIEHELAVRPRDLNGFAYRGFAAVDVDRDNKAEQAP